MIIYSLRVFHIMMVFHWSLSDSMSPQVSRTLLSILNNAVVWMVSTRPPTAKSPSFFDPIHPTPPLGQDMTQGQFLKRSLAGLNSEFSFS